MTSKSYGGIVFGVFAAIVLLCGGESQVAAQRVDDGFKYF
jgi:hypothetical protein